VLAPPSVNEPPLTLLMMAKPSPDARLPNGSDAHRTACRHVPTRRHLPSTKHEVLQHRTNERHAVRCSAELGRATLLGLF
jgi:hypothetical protein